MTLTKEQIEQLFKIKSALSEVQELLGNNFLDPDKCSKEMNDALDIVNDKLVDVDNAIYLLLDNKN